MHWAGVRARTVNSRSNGDIATRPRRRGDRVVSRFYDRCGSIPELQPPEAKLETITVDELDALAGRLITTSRREPARATSQCSRPTCNSESYVTLSAAP